MKLIEGIDSPECHAHELIQVEDIYVANCLRQASPAVVPYDTRDENQR